MVQKLGVMKKIKVGQEDTMYTHNNFRASASVCVCSVAINVRRASVLDLISQATFIRSKKFKKLTSPLIWKGETKLQMLLGLDLDGFSSKNLPINMCHMWY